MLMETPPSVHNSFTNSNRGEITVLCWQPDQSSVSTHILDMHTYTDTQEGCIKFNFPITLSAFIYVTVKLEAESSTTRTV